MAAVYARAGTRCQEHPHRATEERCERCALTFCDECLIRVDGPPGTEPSYFCAGCLDSMREAAARQALERSLAYRAARAARRTRIITLTAVTIGVVLAVGSAVVFVVARRVGAALPSQTIEELSAKCGELSRIRSVGAVGVPAPDDVVNALAYPHRATVRLVQSPNAPNSTPTDHSPDALVDECDAGWRLPTGATESPTGAPTEAPAGPTSAVSEAPHALPLTIEVTPRVEGAIGVQRLALWQDPGAPRGAWVKDFELLTSEREEGEDFVPLRLDRPTTLAQTTEPQWFNIVQAQPMGLTLDRLAFGGAQANGATPPPDVVRVKRLRVRILSTHGAPADGVAVALGEVGAFGPDQEIRVRINCAGAYGLTSCVYGFEPAQLRALAGRPRVVYFVNDSDSAHTFTTVGLDANADVRVGPGQAASILFTAAGRAGRYEFYCKILDHASQGMRGTITVR